MKKLLFITLVYILVSCSSTSPEDKRKQELTQLKQKALVLNNKISVLQRELLNDSVRLGGTEKMAVSVKQLKFETFRHFIESYGKVEAEEDAFISPEMSGQIRNIHVKEGDRVQPGQLLVSLNTSVTQSSIDEVKTGLELAEKLYLKQKSLWEQNIGSELQYLEAKNAFESAKNRLKTLEAQLDMSLLRAPFEGLVDKIFYKEGEMTMPGMQVMQLVNLKRITVTASVSETYLTSIRKDEQVEVIFPSLDNLTRSVRVHRTGNVIEPQSRTFEVELKMDNPGERIKPNMVSVVRINDYRNDQTLVIPSIIIKQDMNGLYVYTVEKIDDQYLARKVYIKTGQSYDDQTMITGGLEAGSQVIVNGYNMVSDNMPVRIVS